MLKTQGLRPSVLLTLPVPHVCSQRGAHLEEDPSDRDYRGGHDMRHSVNLRGSEGHHRRLAGELLSDRRQRLSGISTYLGLSDTLQIYEVSTCH